MKKLGYRSVQNADDSHRMDVIEEGHEQDWEKTILQPVGDVNAEISEFFSNTPDEIALKLGRGDKRTPLSKNSSTPD